MEHILRDNGGYIILTPAFPLPTLKLPVKISQKRAESYLQTRFFCSRTPSFLFLGAKKKNGVLLSDYINKRANKLVRNANAHYYTACSSPSLLKSVQFLSQPARLQTTTLRQNKGLGRLSWQAHRLTRLASLARIEIQYNTIQYNVLYFERVDIHD